MNRKVPLGLWMILFSCTAATLSAQDNAKSAARYADLPFAVGPVKPGVDLRNMVREKVFRQSCAELDRSAARRQQAFAEGEWSAWSAWVREGLLNQYGELPAKVDAASMNIRPVSRYEFPLFSLENVLFESFPGWDVNGSLFLPDAKRFPPPWRAIVIPVGHSSKTRKNYQIPAQAFARMGFAAILFDPPGMASEKQGGNDHFVDGVRTYLTGYSSNRYFIMDAIRCIDYLATRSDIDMRQGVGMTGVSGGGTTTMHAVLLDERIRAAGPACCAVPSAFHPLQDGYSPCAETLPVDKFRSGGDQIDLLCAALPTPVLLMAGEKDEVFKIDWGRAMADEISQAYAIAGVGDRFQFYADPGGHEYTLAMAYRFAGWMDRWIPPSQTRQLPQWHETDFAMLPDSVLYCYPNLDGNMYSLNADIARGLRSARQPTDLALAVNQLARLDKIEPKTECRTGVPQQAWVHWVEELSILPEDGIELPATFIYPMENQPASCLLYFDDRGRWTDLRQQGFLAQLIRFLDRQPPWNALLTVDLRGWGDSSPADGPYEIAAWGHRERWISYVSAASGDPILAMRIRDGLAALQTLRSRPEIDSHRIVVGGSGMGGVVALHLACIDSALAGVFCRNGLATFESLATAPEYTWSPEAFFPRVLRFYDLPELISSLHMPVAVVQPLDAMQKPLAEQQAQETYAQFLAQPQHLLLLDADDSALIEFINRCLKP